MFDIVRVQEKLRMFGVLARTREAAQVIIDECNTSRIDPQTILGDHRRDIYMMARSRIVVELVNRGFPQIQVAKILNKDHSSINYILKRVGRRPIDIGEPIGRWANG